MGRCRVSELDTKETTSPVIGPARIISVVNLVSEGDNVHNVCPTLFTAPCYSNGAVMPSYDVRPSVRLSVTLMDADHIR